MTDKDRPEQTDKRCVSSVTATADDGARMCTLPAGHDEPHTDGTSTWITMRRDQGPLANMMLDAREAGYREGLRRANDPMWDRCPATAPELDAQHPRCVLYVNHEGPHRLDPNRTWEKPETYGIDLEGLVVHEAEPTKPPRWLDFGSKVDVIEPDGTHRYWSTHCRHDRHDDCSATEIHGPAAWGTGLTTAIVRKPAQCKTCSAPCICDCHKIDGGSGGSEGTPE